MYDLESLWRDKGYLVKTKNFRPDPNSSYYYTAYKVSDLGSRVLKARLD